ncbi:MAG: hypothetical protein M1821_005992 [Bathelium mastoideum]|nr:MAG: hypothetical protein M1821_005992 [Bathelium mastoideum]
MAQVHWNSSLFRDGRSKDVILHLYELRRDHSDAAICQALLEAVAQEFLHPKAFSIFLTWAKSDEVIALCIHQRSSLYVRGLGIKHFGKALTDPARWESAWNMMGGTKGLVDLFATLSAAAVKTLASALGRCNRGQKRVEAREKAVEGLLHALLPTHYPGSRLESQDKRPIQGHYAQLAPACSPEFVDQILNAKDESNPLYRGLPSSRLIKAHTKLLRARVSRSLFDDVNANNGDLQFLEAFLYSHPTKPAAQDPRMSESMAFSWAVLQHRLNMGKDKHWSLRISEFDVWSSLLRRSQKRKLPEANIRDVFELGLQSLAINPALKPRFQSTDIWSTLITRWRKSPNIYEALMALALRLGLSGTQRTIGQDFARASQQLEEKPELRWPLLRLYCLHVPKKGFDIETEKDFSLLSNQSWSPDVFSQLSGDQAIRLLQGLYEANPDHNFLQPPRRTSILMTQNVKSQRNFNVALLLTMLQRNDEETQEKAKSAVDELRKKAATAKEQSDRADYAAAASAYAIASGSLDLYKDHTIWQQRYVRDPLTVKAIFHRSVVMTDEGVDLLSGIPQALPRDTHLSKIASRVRKADEVLMILHDTMYLAKREPSFHPPDWYGVTSLFGEAINQRVSRAKKLQKHIQNSDADVYAAIWSGTLEMIEKVDNDFLQAAHGPIKALLSTLRPSALAASTAALLETGNERRKKQDRQPGDHALELLSYECLLQLAKSDKPELAQTLVLRTILDRPDASSWHRQLLSVKFMKSLGAKEANELLLAFATAIGEKLEEQSYVQVGEPEAPKSAPPQSLVKVTTVKYLAQLLDNAEFISADGAVEVLLELFKTGTHRDIRLATLDSLLSLLNSICSQGDNLWKCNALAAKIMAALDTIIPIAGSVNERRPTRPEEWEEAGKTRTPPDISPVSDSGIPPLLNAILTAPDGRQYPSLKKLQAEFVSRYFLPILKLSQAEHGKWNSVFLAKHRTGLTLSDLPPTPISPQLWDDLVARYDAFIPQSVIEDFNKYIIFTIAPPSNLGEMSKSFRRDVKLRNTPEVQHFLFVYGQEMTRYSDSGTQTMVSKIHHDTPQSSINNGMNFERLRDMLSEHASLFLDEYERYTDIWDDFVHDLRPPTKATYPRESTDSIRSMQSRWRRSGRLLLERVTSLLSEARERHRLDKKSGILPFVTKPCLWLLPFPSFPEEAQADKECKAFATGLERLLAVFLAGESSVLQWPRIAEDAYTVSDLLNTDKERLSVATYIGNRGDGKDGPADQRSLALGMVRVMLAMRLVEDARHGLTKILKRSSSGEAEHLVQRLRDMFESWHTHANESIREKAAAWKKQQKDLWKAIMSGKML